MRSSGLRASELRWCNGDAGHDALQSVNYNILPGLKTGLDHPHIARLWAQFHGLDCDLVVGRDYPHLKDSLKFRNRLLRNQDCTFAQLSKGANTGILTGTKQVA